MSLDYCDQKSFGESALTTVLVVVDVHSATTSINIQFRKICSVNLFDFILSLDITHKYQINLK